MPNGKFDLTDPSTYNIRQGGLPDQKFVYTVKASITSRFGQSSSQHITIRSQNTLTEQQLLEEAANIINSSAKSRYQGTVDNLEVTDATRPASRGV